MANVNNVRNFKPTTVELGGKERTIQFDLNAFAELERHFGSVDQAFAALESGSMQNIKVVLWAGLIHEEVELDPVSGEPIKYLITPYQVGSWIKNPLMLQDVSAKLSEAMGISLPDIENMPEVKAELEKRGLTVTDGKVATVVLTEEEKAAAAAEQAEKNG